MVVPRQRCHEGNALPAPAVRPFRTGVEWNRAVKLPQIGTHTAGRQTMQKCPRCGNEFSGQECPRCGGKSKPSAAEIDEAVGKYLYLGFTGLAGTALSTYLYPTVERNLLSVIAGCLFFLPLALHALRGSRKGQASDMNRLKAAYLYCGAGVVLIALMLIMNGALDWAPPRIESSSILEMRITSGKYSSTHHLVLISWRPGRAKEDLAVGTALYAHASVGQRVSVEVHKGLFGLPWYGKVTLE